MKPYFFKGIPSEKALKPQIFHLEDTHLIDRNKLVKLLAILAIAFVWCCKAGIWLNEKEPIRLLKKTGKRLCSFFKYGFGYIQHLLLNLLKKQELKYVFALLSLYGSQIYKSMAKILYPDFMENTAAYDVAENMWKEVLDALATEHGFSHAPYLDTRLSNGKKERDANPLYNTYVVILNRAIRILQIIKEEVGDLHISGWVDTF